MSLRLVLRAEAAHFPRQASWRRGCAFALGTQVQLEPSGDSSLICAPFDGFIRGIHTCIDGKLLDLPNILGRTTLWGKIAIPKKNVDMKIEIC